MKLRKADKERLIRGEKNPAAGVPLAVYATTSGQQEQVGGGDTNPPLYSRAMRLLLDQLAGLVGVKRNLGVYREKVYYRISVMIGRWNNPATRRVNVAVSGTNCSASPTGDVLAPKFQHNCSAQKGGQNLCQVDDASSETTPSSELAKTLGETAPTFDLERKERSFFMPG